MQQTYGELGCVSFEHSLEIQLLDLPLQTRGQARVHGGASRQDNVLVELSTCVYVCSLEEGGGRRWEMGKRGDKV